MTNLEKNYTEEIVFNITRLSELYVTCFQNASGIIL